MDEVIFGPVQLLVIVFDNPSFEAIPEGTAAAILIIEHLWAKSLKQAIRGAGGVLVSQGMFTIGGCKHKCKY